MIFFLKMDLKLYKYLPISSRQYVCQQLLSKCKNQKDRMSPEKRIMLAQLPKFLEALKHEVLNDDSSIWDATFKPPLGLLLQRKRERELNSSVMQQSSAMALAAASSSSGKKYNEPSSSKKQKRDTDVDDLTDDVVAKAIKKINKSNYSNRAEVKDPRWHFDRKIC